MPRIRYTGAAEAGVPAFPGLWQPGQEQDVSEEDARYLLGSSQFLDVNAPPPVPEPLPVEAPPAEQAAPTSEV